MSLNTTFIKMFVEKPFPFVLQSVVSFLTVISHLCFLHQIIDVTLMGIFETDKKTVKTLFEKHQHTC